MLDYNPNKLKLVTLVSAAELCNDKKHFNIDVPIAKFFEPLLLLDDESL